MNQNHKIGKYSRLTKSVRDRPLAKSMPKKLLPLPFHRNNINFFKNEMTEFKMPFKTPEEMKMKKELPNVDSKILN